MLELNKILNMDCLEGMKMIPDGSVDLVLTDIPYGECNGRKLGGKGGVGMRSINKGDADEVNFDIGELVDQVTRICRGSVYMFCGTEQVSVLRQSLQDKGMTTRLCIWEKTNPSPMNGQYLWLSSVECCVFGRFPKASFNEHCKSSVWRFPCGTSKIHPTQKPLNMFSYLVRVSSNEGDVVLDPFMGSGTTAIACINEKRNFIGFEISEDYYRLANKRIDECLYGHVPTTPSDEQTGKSTSILDEF